MKKLLLTGVSIIALSTATQAGLEDNWTEVEPSVRLRKSTVSKDSVDSKIDLLSQYPVVETKKVDVSQLHQKQESSKMESDLLSSKNFVFVDDLLSSKNFEKIEDLSKSQKLVGTELPKLAPLAGFTIDEVVKYNDLASLAYIDVNDQEYFEYESNPEKFKQNFMSSLWRVFSTKSREDQFKEKEAQFKARKAEFDVIEKHKAEGSRVYFFGTENENSGLIIQRKDGHVEVVYKGTDSKRNVLTDLWATYTTDKVTGLSCHTGFMNGFYRTKDQVFGILEQIAKEQIAIGHVTTVQQFFRDQVTYLGHSLGGALAQYAEAYTESTYHAVAKIITIASPAMFDTASEKILDAKIHNRYLNVIQETDPVPGVTKLLFRPLGTKFYIPYSKLHYQHLLSGYGNAIEAIRQNGQVIGYKFEERK